MLPEMLSCVSMERGKGEIRPDQCLYSTLPNVDFVVICTRVFVVTVKTL